MRLFKFDYLEGIICYEEATGNGAEGGTGGAELAGGAEGGGVIDADGNLTNTAKGGIVTITGELEEGTVTGGEGEREVEIPGEETSTEITLDGFDDVFDWEEGEKEQVLEKIKQAGITPEQFGLFKELTGDMLDTVASLQESTEKLQNFIKRDYQAEGQKLQEAGMTKAEVQDLINFAGGLMGEGGADRLAQVVNSAEMIFALKAMKEKIVGTDNSLEGSGTQTEPVYTQDAFVQDLQKYYKMSAEGKTLEAQKYLHSIKERARKYGEPKLKKDVS